MANKITFNRNKLTKHNWFPSAKNKVNVEDSIKELINDINERLIKVETTLEQLVNKK